MKFVDNRQFNEAAAETGRSRRLRSSPAGSKLRSVAVLEGQRRIK